MVGLWIALGFLWVALNPNKHHAKSLVTDRQSSSGLTPVGS